MLCAFLHASRAPPQAPIPNTHPFQKNHTTTHHNSNLECLNEDPSHPAANALKQGYREDGGLVCASDADEQLLFNVPFNQVCLLLGAG